MTKTVLCVLCLIAVFAILFNNWDSIAYAQNEQDYGGYSSLDEYCKAEYGEEYFFDPVNYSCGISTDAPDDLLFWDENRPLNWSDFQGEPNTYSDDYVGDRSDTAGAHTTTGVPFNWKSHITQNQPCMYTITEFDANAYFAKPRSWVKSELTSDMFLLNHEQKHFDLAEVQARKFNKVVATEFLGKEFACPSFNGQSQDDTIFIKIREDLNRVAAQYGQEKGQMDLDYDAQTTHGTYPTMQKEWDNYIANLLDYYEPFKDKQDTPLTQEEIEANFPQSPLPPEFITAVISVGDYATAKGWEEGSYKPVNRTTVFSDQDELVYFWIEFINVIPPEHKVDFKFYEPDGELYSNSTTTIENVREGQYLWPSVQRSTQMYIKDYGVADRPGLWKIAVYLDGDLIKEVPFTIVQSEGGGGCLIATATYGSELAPQVQFLREIRDNTVLSTTSGTSFMTTFNSFYYSFSPTVADLERQNPVFKETVKVAITPLLSSLSLLQYVDINTESEMLGYGIGIILLNIGMYFVAPAILILKLKPILRTKQN